ncbi:Kinetochore protein fta7 [Zalerion maritima]|uniref:Kinetochore protein fta7 n=1 Tax=Zalerion maritima TaxID=339359 RepID=A0AAD5RNZ5_9PEZI|nr:Kinetochore protein fta7 [Zalerion maritima]
MPPASPNQNRKRGRPTASAQDEVASRRQRLRKNDSNTNVSRDKVPEQTENDDDRPRKRTRKDKEDKVPALAAAEAPNPKTQGRKPRALGQPSVIQKGRREATYEADTEADVATKKRGRPSKAHKEGEQAVPMRNKSNRTSSASQIVENLTERRKKTIRPNRDELAPKKRGRPSQEQTEEDHQPKKRGRSSRGQSLEEEQEGAPQENGMRKRRRKTVQEEDAEEQEDAGNAKPRNGRRRSEKDQDGRPSASDSKRRPIGRSRELKLADEEQPGLDEPEEPEAEGNEEEEEEELDYDGLIPQINAVSSRTIKSKWSPLDSPSIAMVTSLLHDAARPVLLRLKDEKKRAFAASALQAISNRLRTKMSRGLPFPPASTALKKKPRRRKGAFAPQGKEQEGESRLGELSFETTVDGVRAAQQRLTPLLHSVALLKKEKEKEEKQLRRDYENLQALERNSREQKNSWRAQLRKGGHALVPTPIPASNVQDEAHDQEDSMNGEVGLELLPVDKVAGRTFRDTDDPEHLDLASQAKSHMDSIGENLKQIIGVVPAIERTRAALQGVLHERLDGESYGRVVLG